MAEALMWITLVVLALVVLVLAFYLISVIFTLTKANRKLVQLAGGLEAIRDHTQPLPQHLTTINGALADLQQGLRSVDSHLVGIAGVFSP